MVRADLLLSPWAQDKAVDMVVSPAPIQSKELVPLRSAARETAYATPRFLSVDEAVQAARLYRELDPEQQTLMLSVGGLGTGTSWTAMHRSSTDILRTRSHTTCAVVNQGSKSKTTQGGFVCAAKWLRGQRATHP